MRRLLDRQLDTILENNSPTTPYREPDPNATATYQGQVPQGQTPANGATATYNGSQPGRMADQMGSGEQWQQLRDARQQWKADKLGAMSVDQKIQMALQQSEEAQKIAYQTSRQVSVIDGKLDRAFASLAGMIKRISSGQPPQEPHQPGTSIWDDDNDGGDDDPESILSQRRP